MLQQVGWELQFLQLQLHLLFIWQISLFQHKIFVITKFAGGLHNVTRHFLSKEVAYVTAPSTKRVRRQLTWISGQTTEGYPVIAGVFDLVDSQGIPLSILLESFKEKNIVVDWDHFLTQSIKRKWNWSTTLSKIEEAVGEVYGKHYKEQVLTLCKAWYMWKGRNLFE